MNEQLNKYLILQSVSVKEAMKKLDISGRKILFVISVDDTLLGSLSDGDIRRWILSGGDLESMVEHVCNRNPHTVSQGYSVSEIKKLMIQGKIDSIPVLEEDRKIHDIVFGEEIFSDHEKRPAFKAINIPVVIMAGGKGTRLEPFTSVLPKPLIPIGNQTISECIIDEFRKFDVSQFYLTLNYKGSMIEAYFNGTERSYKIDYLRENGFYGTAGSLSLLKEKIDTDIIVSNCDNIVKANYYDVLEFHRNNNSFLTVLSSIQYHKIPYGVVMFQEGGVVTSIIEKPEYTFTINTGVYILNKKALNYIPEQKIFHMTNLIDSLIADKKKVLTYPVNEGDYVDIGQWDDYRKAVDKFQG